MIYIATTEHGRGIQHVTKFVNRLDFFNYAADVLSCHDRNSMINKGSTISRICDTLADNGVGFGSRSHRRISTRALFNLCALFPRNHDCWKLCKGGRWGSNYCKLTGRAIEILEELALIKKNKEDWFDSHVEIVGLPKKQTEQLKRKLKEQKNV